MKPKYSFTEINTKESKLKVLSWDCGIKANYVQSLVLLAWSLGSTFAAILLYRQLLAARSSVTASLIQSSSLNFGNFTTDEDRKCHNWLADEGDPSSEPWRFLKWIPRRAKCQVRGMWLEEFEPRMYFRRSIRSGHFDFWDPALLPFLRGFQDDSLAKRERRVLLDLGANKFTTSTAWFCHVYPLDFTEIHSFEAESNLFIIPPPMTEAQEKEATEQQNLNMIPTWQLNRIKAYTAAVGLIDGANQVNITRFMKEELKLTPNDTVIVKMDIKGAEWDIIPTWLKDPEMRAIVDEIFVEVHYNHPSFAWLSLPDYGHNQEEAIQMLQSLRANGFFTHFWPSSP